MAETLQPRSFGDLFGQTFSVFFKSLGRLVAIQVLFWLPLILVGAAAFAAALLLGDGLEDVEGAGLTVAQVMAFGVGAVSLVLLLLLSPVPGAASILVIADRFTGEHTPLGTAFRVAFSRLAGLLGIGLALGACFIPAVLGLMSMAVLPFLAGYVFLPFGVVLAVTLAVAGAVAGLALFSMLFVAVPALVLERASVGAALRRSRDLTRGFRRRTLGLFGVMYIVGTAISTAVRLFLEGGTALLVRSEAGQIAATVLSYGFNQVVTGGLFGVLTVVVYFDLRVRSDGFDLENLAQLVDVIAEREGAPPLASAATAATAWEPPAGSSGEAAPPSEPPAVSWGEAAAPREPPATSTGEAAGPSEPPGA